MGFLASFFEEASSLLCYRIIFQDTLSIPKDETEEGKGNNNKKRNYIVLKSEDSTAHQSAITYKVWFGF